MEEKCKRRKGANKLPFFLLINLSSQEDHHSWKASKHSEDCEKRCAG